MLQLVFFTMLPCITAWGKTTPVNKNFNNRFEYVISILEHITESEEDIPLGLTVVVDNKASYQLFIGVKELFNVLYGEPFKSKDQLYFSVGKVFLKDTLALSQDKSGLFKNYMVDSIILKSERCESRDRKGLNRKEDNAIGYYFDRKFYPTLSVHNRGDVIDFEYSFRSSNLIQIFRDGKIYNQIYDRNGNFIWEASREEINEER